MQFNRAKFFAGFKSHFDSTLNQSQVDGIEFLLQSFESDPLWTNDLRNISYALATIYHETAGSMQPVEEGYYLGSSARVKAFQRKLRYYPYYGRGYVQLTWKSNYQTAANATGIDLVNHPELALQNETAFQVLTLGMFRGWFSKGNKLGTYITPTTADYLHARKIINGLDKAPLIAGYARTFETLLNSAASSQTQTPTSDKPSNPISQPDNLLDANSGAAVVSQDPIPVEQVTATKDPPPDPPKETWLDKLNAKALALQGGILTAAGTVFSWLTSASGIVTMSIIGGVVLVTSVSVVTIAIRNSGKEKRAKDTADKERELTMQREKFAHEIQLLTLQAAADPNMNSVKIVPPPVPLANSDTVT